MTWMCKAGKHVARAAIVANQGFEFSRCRCCGGDIVRSKPGAGGWREVPRGFRVVWKSRPAARPATGIEWPIVRAESHAPATPETLAPAPARRRSPAAAMRRLLRAMAGGLTPRGRLMQSGPAPVPAVLRLPSP